jgi:hypothetical protein
MRYCEDCRRIQSSHVCECGGLVVDDDSTYYDEQDIIAEMFGPPVPPVPVPPAPVPPAPATACIWCQVCGADTPHSREQDIIACAWCGSR